VLRLLSLLSGGGFTAHGAARMLGADVHQLDLVLAGLVETHFLRVVGPDAAGETCYTFHELARLYATERLEIELQDLGARTEEFPVMAGFVTGETIHVDGGV
jgi:hypothetical protein